MILFFGYSRIFITNIDLKKIKNITKNKKVKDIWFRG